MLVLDFLQHKSLRCSVTTAGSDVVADVSHSGHQASGAERSGSDEDHDKLTLWHPRDVSKLAVEAFVLEICSETRIATNSRANDTCVDCACSEVKAGLPCGPTCGLSA